MSAVADPVRRDILGLLRDRPRTAGAIASAFPISRPAISRHLRVLRTSGLVIDDVDPVDGRGRVYRLETAPLREIEAWLAQFRPGWSHALEALATEVHRTRRERPSRARADTTIRSSA